MSLILRRTMLAVVLFILAGWLTWRVKQDAVANMPPVLVTMVQQSTQTQQSLRLACMQADRLAHPSPVVPTNRAQAEASLRQAYTEARQAEAAFRTQALPPGIRATEEARQWLDAQALMADYSAQAIAAAQAKLAGKPDAAVQVKLCKDRANDAAHTAQYLMQTVIRQNRVRKVSTGS
ncbi:MAG TPA: hypothetical protein VHR86_06285 [Armatimonadota bacterium]|nr:hypothetical protein [Armatimonadota bacterium]